MAFVVGAAARESLVGPPWLQAEGDPGHPRAVTGASLVLQDPGLQHHLSPGNLPNHSGAEAWGLVHGVATASPGLHPWVDMASLQCLLFRKEVRQAVRCSGLPVPWGMQTSET